MIGFTLQLFDAATMSLEDKKKKYTASGPWFEVIYHPYSCSVCYVGLTYCSD